MLYKIAIDRANATYISGWCFHRLKQDRPTRLQCFRGNEIVGEAMADRMREDVRELGIHPSGRCGFEIVLKRAAGNEGTRHLYLRPEGSSRVLAVIDPQGTPVVREPGLFPWLKNVLLRAGISRRTLVFMHIPKTAGTSFNTLIAATLPRKRVCSHIELVDPSRLPELSRRCEYLSGHLRIGVLRDMADRQHALYFSIVREPYAQLHSHLKWLMATAADESDNYFKIHNPVIYELGKELGAIDCSRPERLAAFVDNLSDLAALFLDNMQTRYFLDHEPRRVQQTDLQLAIDNTDCFSLIGLTEYYEEFVSQFASMTGLTVQAGVRILNKSPSAPLFAIEDKAVRTALKPLVRYDLALYEHLVQRKGVAGTHR